LKRRNVFTVCRSKYIKIYCYCFLSERNLQHGSLNVDDFMIFCTSRAKGTTLN
jgi:hypothetical protein